MQGHYLKAIKLAEDIIQSIEKNETYKENHDLIHFYLKAKMMLAKCHYKIRDSVKADEYCDYIIDMIKD